jgi:hypothetical protein
MLQISSVCVNNANITLQLRAAGVTATATDYNEQLLQVNSTTVSGTRSAAAASVDICTTSAGATLYNFSQTMIYQPQLAAATGFQTMSQYHNSATFAQPIRQDWFGNHSLATAYDGFIISVSGGNTISGTYAVYGYSKTV